MVPAGDGREPLRQGRCQRPDQGMRGAGGLPALVLQRHPPCHRDHGPRGATRCAADAALLRQGLLRWPVQARPDAGVVLELSGELRHARAPVPAVLHHGAPHRDADNRRRDRAGASPAAARHRGSGVQPWRGCDVPHRSRRGSSALQVVPRHHPWESCGGRVQASPGHHVAAAAVAAHRIRRGAVGGGRLASGADGCRVRESKARGRHRGAACAADAVLRVPGRP
mmetsp:Transcript_46902/g.118694  ORF Transcript_46902/g.118694 Transcript_46902/m.118694 type:complete len:225 (-) Transcript_46902:1018-1692(-)